MPWRKKLKEVLKATPLFEVPKNASGVSAVMALLGKDQKTHELQILLMKRTHHVETHKGQIAFPGGFREDTDPGILETALREAEEELGIRRSDVEVLGPLTPVWTRGEVIISPWVGVITFPYSFTPNPQEVDRVLFLPLERLLSEGLHPVDVKVSPQLTVKSLGIEVDGELVWGATAQMLDRLRKALLE